MQSHACQSGIGSELVSVFELRHTDRYQGVLLRAGKGRGQLRRCQRADILVKRDVLVGKQSHKAVLIARIALEKSGSSFVLNIPAFGGVHHLRSLLFSVCGGKGLLADVAFFVWGTPLRIKGKSVEQKHYSIFADLIQDLLDFAIGLIGYPLVDFLERPLVVKVALVRLRTVVIGIEL